MAGHYKLMWGGVVLARGTEDSMRANRNMQHNSKGKLQGQGSSMTIEFDEADYPFTGKDEPKVL